MKTFRNLYAAMAVAALASSAPAAFSIPAKPGLLQDLVQPDGTVVKATLIGDEFGHYYATPDFFPLVRNAAGAYCYATLAEDGSVVPTTFEARNAEFRGASVQSFLSTVPVEDISAKLLEPGASKRVRMNSERRSAPALVADSDGYDNPSWQIGLFNALCPHDGERHNLVILVEYTDVKFSMDDPHAYFTDYLNQEGFDLDGATGSVRDYFVASSNGKYLPTFDVYGPVTLPNNQKYYGENGGWGGGDLRPEEMVVDACRILDDEIDFTIYDTDGNGYVDNVYILYAGGGEATGAGSNTVWPHQYELHYKEKQIVCDGVTIDHYGCGNEVEGGVPTGLGTFCHEFSHVLGLPDLYNTVSSSRVTPGYWTIMDVGSYLNDSHTPPTYSSFERNAMGWIKPEPFTDSESVVLPALSEVNTARIANTARPQEFFLFENRQQTGWDAYLPGHGMIVWHIDYEKGIWQSNAVNNRDSHQYVDIVEAGNSAYVGNWDTMASYSFPGTKGVTEFTATGTPAFMAWTGEPIEFPITEIEETPEGMITFNVLGGRFDLDTPELRLVDTTPGGFTLEWDAVDKAREYYATVARILPDGDEVVAAYDDVCLGLSTTLVAERLLGDATYRASVYARASVNYSPVAETIVTTLPASFEYLVPRVAQATGVSADGFTANWLPVEGAVAYLLDIDLAVKSPGDTVTMTFGDIYGNYSLPEGWESSDDAYYTSSSKAFVGESAPSGKLTKNNSYIQTAVYADEVMAVKLWLRQAGSSADNSLVLQGRTDETADWVELAVHNPLVSTAGGETVVFEELPEGFHQLRFSYLRPKTGNLALDDIKITMRGEAFDPWQTGINVADATHYNAVLPEGSVKARYAVKAEDATGRRSLLSDYMVVELGDNGGIGSIAADGTGSVSVTVVGGTAVVKAVPGSRIDVYDLAGRAVATAVAATDGVARIALPQGFYIVAGQKVIVK